MPVSGKPKVSTEVPGCKCGVEWNQNSIPFNENKINKIKHSRRKRRSTTNTTISDSDNNRIIGGTKIDKQTQMRKYPWLSLLWFRPNPDPDPTNTQYRVDGWAGCGGTVVASNYIISAAHCLFKRACNPDTNICYAIEEYTKDNLAWRVGDHDLGVFYETGYEWFVKIKNMHKHPDYPQKVHPDLDQCALGQCEEFIESGEYDIVVFELEEMLPLDVYTPACLPKPGEDARFDGKMATIAGWGRLSYDGPTPKEPYEVNVPVAQTDTCPTSMIEPVKLCLGQNSPLHKGACLVGR